MKRIAGDINNTLEGMRTLLENINLFLKTYLRQKEKTDDGQSTGERWDTIKWCNVCCWISEVMGTKQSLKEKIA